MLSLYIALIAAKVQIAALEMTPPEVEYVEVPVYITEYVPYYVTEYVEAEPEVVEVPQWNQIKCSKCGKVEEFGLMVEDGDELSDVCYDCWLANGENGWVSVMVEVEDGEEKC